MIHRLGYFINFEVLFPEVSLDFHYMANIKIQEKLWKSVLNII